MSSIQIVPGTRAALRSVPASFDYSRFLGFYEARSDGNTTSKWLDLSPNGRHLTADGTYQLTTDTAGRDVYRATSGTPGWQVPNLSDVAQDYTFYALIRPATTDNVFLLDADTDRTVVGVNVSAGGLYYGTWTMQNPVAAGALMLLTYRMNSNGAAILHNNQPYATGTYSPRRLTNRVYFARANDSAANALLGDILAWGITAGNDTDAQVDATNKYLLSF